MTNITYPTQMPFFVATLSSPISNVTGDGTAYTCLFDTLSAGSGYNTSNGNYTAPMSGYYIFSITISATGITASHTLGVIQAVSTFGTLTLSDLKFSSYRNSSNNAIISSVLALKMAAGDTCNVLWTVSNSTKVITFDSASIFSGTRTY